jgi:hypothetical protein
MARVQIRDPQRFAREALWRRFNCHAGLFTKFVTDHEPQRTRLFLDNSEEVEVEGWMSDFGNNVSVLYKMRDDTWMLYSQWCEVDDPEVSTPIAYAVISAPQMASVARAVALLESAGEEDFKWLENLSPNEDTHEID